VYCVQALSQKEAERASLTEKILSLQQDLAIADMEVERMQREALSKQEQDKVKIWQGHPGHGQLICAVHVI